MSITRNLELKQSETNSYWNIVTCLDIEAYLRKLGRNLALQGELVGSGIQSNPYKLQYHKLYIYNVYDINTQLDLSFSEQYQLVVDVLGLDYVPIVKFDYELPKDVVELIEFADGKSKLNSQANREGLVLRDLNSSQTFKVISNNYLLKQKD